MSKTKEQRRESGQPGGGAGRKDEVGRSGVYPMSGPHPSGDAPIVTPASWGQGTRGAAGYEDHGESELDISIVEPEKCRDLMTKNPVCCLPGDNVCHAARLMEQNDVGVLPVVFDQKEKILVGMITDRDVTVRAVANGRDPSSILVDEIMSRKIVKCSPDDSCEQALNLMEEWQVRRIPAVDASGRVVGIISQADVAIRVRDTNKTAELVTAISLPQ